VDPVAPQNGGLAAKLSQVVDHYAGEYRPIGALTYEVLRQGIINGAFAPGSVLRQQTIAHAIGVSRSPVRNALSRLESEGWVTLEPDGSARVRDRDSREQSP
jgi:DNA-binding GntR family transcriptional regulator